jgi:hypothetical protein
MEKVEEDYRMLSRAIMFFFFFFAGRRVLLGKM